MNHKSKELIVKAGSVFQKTFKVVSGQVFLYEYWASGDLQFWISQGYK